MAPLYSLGNIIWQTWIYTLTEDAFKQVLAFLGKWFWQKRFLKDFFYNLFLYKESHCVPTPSGVMIWINLNLQCLRKLPHKFQFVWQNGFWEDFNFFSLFMPLYKSTPIEAPPYPCGPLFKLTLSTLPKDAFTKFSAYLANFCCWEKCFKMPINVLYNFKIYCEII